MGTDDKLWQKIQEDNELLKEEDKKLKPLLNEINLIEDAAIKSFTRALMLQVDEFWVGPSSPSGKFHPPDERGVGGDVLHTKRVVQITRMLAFTQERDFFEVDMLTSAALLHDITKLVDRGNGVVKSDPMHMLTVDRLLSSVRSLEIEGSLVGGSTVLDLDSITSGKIMRCVRCHYGKFSPIPEVVPVTPFEMTVHWADHLASKLHEIEGLFESESS